MHYSSDLPIAPKYKQPGRKSGNAQLLPGQQHDQERPESKEEGNKAPEEDTTAIGQGKDASDRYSQQIPPAHFI